MLEKPNVLLDLVKALVARLSIPLSVKVRLLPNPDTKLGHIDKSLDLYRNLVDAGVHLLTIHGRTRFQKGSLTKHSDWEAIRRVVNELGQRIPIFANGSIGNMEDVEECLRVTQADGVMSSEAILEYPPLFANPAKHKKSQAQLAYEYLEWNRKYPNNKGGQGSGSKCVRSHLHHFLHCYLMKDIPTRQAICRSEPDELYDIVKKMAKEKPQEAMDPQESWYRRYRNAKNNKFQDNDAKEDKKRSADAMNNNTQVGEEPKCEACEAAVTP